jgi:hypothetical protein
MLADSNRELVVSAGGLPALIDMLKHPSAEVPFMQSAAAACICNLAANINSKEIIATSGALEVLVQVRSRMLTYAHVCSRIATSGALEGLVQVREKCMRYMSMECGCGCGHGCVL